jgi:hypothetical protein
MPRRANTRQYRHLWTAQTSTNCARWFRQGTADVSFTHGGGYFRKRHCLGFTVIRWNVTLLFSSAPWAAETGSFVFTIQPNAQVFRYIGSFHLLCHWKGFHLAGIPTARPQGVSSIRAEF